jgi:tetratricopeptide (TPR) repeat protein
MMYRPVAHRQKGSLQRAAVCATAAFLLAGGAFVNVFAEKVLMYDEEKGIIFLDKDAPQEAPSHATAPRPEAVEKAIIKRSSSVSRDVDTSLIRGKKKDPSEAYFESGLQYFKAANYDEALRLFLYADSTDPQPKYALWVGKTYRQLGKSDRHLFIMHKILDTDPESDVADDALFEIAFSFQVNDDYDKAAKTYTQLSEQYPFGTSFSNGESFRDISKQQKLAMRSEIVTTLRLLGYNGTEIEDLVSSFQSARGLPATGLCDRKTVRAIKAEYKEFQKNEEKAAARRLRRAAFMKWAVGLCCFSAIAGIVMIGIRVSAASKKRQLAVLEQTLADLDGRQI